MSLKTLIASTTFILTSQFMPTPSLAGDVGVMSFTFDAPHRDRLVQSLVFYPAAEGGVKETVGDNLVFHGEALRRDARPAKGKHDLVIVSHGSGGNAAGLSWLAARLADAGFVVAIPNHQGSTSADSTPETTIPAMWLRPADLNQMLDAFEGSTAIMSFVDTSNVALLGFSLGGAVALNMAGAEFRGDKLAAFCDANPEAIGCPWLAQGNALIPGHVDLHNIDTSKFNSSYPDGRIKRITAIDPGFIPALDMDSVAKVGVPLQVINLGDLKTMNKGIRADHVASAAANGSYANIASASHFDFLPDCKMLGWFFIWMEGDDPVCTSSGNRARPEIHEEVAAKVIGFLK